MSLILEALRKSEAERQRGRAPGLFVEQAPASRRKRGAPAWSWGLGVLLLAVLALFTWREWGRSAATGGDTTASAGPAIADTALPAPLPAAPPAATPAQAPDVPSGPTAAAAAATTAAPLPAPATATATMPSSATAPAPVPSPATTTVSAAATTASPELAEPADLALPTLANLDASERTALPPLRLSMHVFAEEPAQRFVILDGQRLGEGARPAPGVVLEQIRRDGLVLSVNGRRVLLPRP